MRKIIDDRGRLFGLISVIDIIVIIVIAVLAVAFYTKFNVLDNPLTSANTVRVTYTVKIPAIRDKSAALLRSGDKLYSAENGAFIGTIENVSIAEAEDAEYLVDGTYVMAKADEKYDVTLTVGADCSSSNGRFYADRTFELNANAELKLCTKYNEITGIVMTITAG